MAIVSLVVIGGGLAKLAGVEMVLMSFATLGLPAWFGTFIGAAEVAGGIGIWHRKTSALAAAGLSIIMLGAIYYHIMHTPIARSAGGAKIQTIPTMFIRARAEGGCKAPSPWGRIGRCQIENLAGIVYNGTICMPNDLDKNRTGKILIQKKFNVGI